MSYAQDTLIYQGFLVIQDTGTMYPYKLKISQKKSNIEGFSITNENLNNETTNKIIGSYIKKDKILELQEQHIVETNSTVSLNNFCFLQLNLKMKKKELKGSFVGYFNDSTICSTGDVLLLEDRVIQKKIKKLEKVIPKEELKKIQDEINKHVVDKNEPNQVVDITEPLSNNDIFSVSFSDPFTFSVWDSQTEDGDMIKVLVDDRVLLDDFVITNTKHVIKFYDYKKTSYFKIIAKNIGSRPPNSVNIELKSNKKEIQLQTKLDSSEFVYIKIN